MRTKNNFFIIVVFIVSILYLFISFLPNFYEASVTDLVPQDRIMLWGEHIYTYDYNVYLSKVRQGQEGRWTVVDKYDNHVKQKGVLLQMLYLLTGKLGSVLNLDPTLSFHLLRTVVSLSFILVIFYLNYFYLKKPRLILSGVLFSLLAASFPVFYKYLGETWVGQHMAWWQEMDVLKRISYIPHYTLNYIFVSLFAVLLNKLNINSKNATSVEMEGLPTARRGIFERALAGGKLRQAPSQIQNTVSSFYSHRTFLAICIILFFSFFIHPSAPPLFFFMWFIYHFLSLVWFKLYDRKTVLKLILQIFILVLVAAIPFFYLKSVTANYPWKSLVEFDQTNRLAVDLKEYILALGPIFFTGMLGLIVVLIKKNQELLSLVSWVLGAFLAIIIFKKIPVFAELRFVQTANHLPLAILSVYFLFELKTLILKSGWRKESEDTRFERLGIPSETRRVPTGVKNAVSNFLIYGIICGISTLGIVQSYFSIKAQTDFIHQRAVAVQPLVPYPPQVMYPLKDFYNALSWLEKNTKNEEVILSKITAGNYIPAYSGNFVYLGHNPETPQYPQKVERVNEFFSGTMDPQNSLNFLESQNISYVFYGPQEKENPAFNPKNYPFLKGVFASTYVTIYTIRK